MGDPVHAGRGRWSIEAQLRDALRRARLLDWVESLPHGLQTLVGERGARLSGGQRRRLALARALLADFPVLVADEPTEHLDDETARGVTADLLDATRDRAVLIITHQPFDGLMLDRLTVPIDPKTSTDVIVGLLVDRLLPDQDGPKRRVTAPA